MIKEEYIRKNITITENQEKYIKDKSINLSRFIQNKLNKEIKKENVKI